MGKQAPWLYAPSVPPLLPLLCFNNPPSSPCLRVTLLQTLNTSSKTYHSKILKTHNLIIILKHNHLRFPKPYWHIHNKRMLFKAPKLSIKRSKYFSKNNFAVTTVIHNHHITC